MTSTKWPPPETWRVTTSILHYDFSRLGASEGEATDDASVQGGSVGMQAVNTFYEQGETTWSVVYGVNSGGYFNRGMRPILGLDVGIEYTSEGAVAGLRFNPTLGQGQDGGFKTHVYLGFRLANQTNIVLFAGPNSWRGPRLGLNAGARVTIDIF